MALDAVGDHDLGRTGRWHHQRLLTSRALRLAAGKLLLDLKLLTALGTTKDDHADLQVKSSRTSGQERRARSPPANTSASKPYLHYWKVFRQVPRSPRWAWTLNFMPYAVLAN